MFESLSERLGGVFDRLTRAGALTEADVVTALHQVPIGEAWTRAAVEQRKAIIENGPPGRSPLTSLGS